MRSRRVRTFFVVVIALTLAVSWAHPSPAQSIPASPPASPETSLQVWTVNIRQLEFAWEGFIERMATAQFAPDLILVQEICDCDRFGSPERDVDEFRFALDNRFPGSYFFHSSDTDGTQQGGNNAIFWKQKRLLWEDIRTWTQLEETSCTASSLNPKKAIAVLFRDRMNGGAPNIVAASVHFDSDPEFPSSCVHQNISLADQALENLAQTHAGGVRRVSIIGGDFNQRPDMDGNTALDGLEQDPDCWYLRASIAHYGCSSNHDRYLDVVWAYPGSGGGTNPTATSFCEQFTHSRFIQPLDPEVRGITNSCTDLVNNRTGSELTEN